MTQSRPEVFFIQVQDDEHPDSVAEKINTLLDKAGFQSIIKSKEIVSIKTHFGEKGNKTHLTPDQIRPVVNKIKEYGGKPFLTELGQDKGDFLSSGQNITGRGGGYKRVLEPAGESKKG